MVAAPKRVFISYSSRDRIEALALRKIVEESGGQTWMDIFDIAPAAPLERELGRGVTSVDVLCLLLSPTAVASRWVREEIARARAAEGKGVKVLPIVLRPTAVPDTLSDLVAIDATRGVEDPSVALRLRQFFADDVAEGLRLDAFNRAELADRETRINAEAALAPLRQELTRVWDQPLRELTLEIDQDTWPEASGVLELVLTLDMFRGSAHVLVAPYVEGGTWRVEAGFEERAPEDIGPDRLDARFRWAGRTLVLRAQLDGSDLGERPTGFGITLDGSEVTGAERATSMQLVTTFELPSLRQLVDKGSHIDLWLHRREAEPVRIDPATTDLDLRLDARVAHDAIHSVSLWRSRHERPERVVLEAPTLKACATDLEREVLLSTYLSRPLRAPQNARDRRARVTQLVESNEAIPAEDRWAAAHLLRGRGDLAVERRQTAQAMARYRSALQLMLEDFVPEQATFRQFDAAWRVALRLGELLANAGEEGPMRQVLGVAIDLARAMRQAHAGDRAYGSALAEALVKRAELEPRGSGDIDRAALEEAITVIDVVAGGAPPLPWRIAQAQSLHTRVDALRPPSSDGPAPPVYARWLDPKTAGPRDVPILCISALPRFSAKLSARAYGDKRLHLADDELIAIYGDASRPGWFSVGCRETRSVPEESFAGDTLLGQPPFSLIGFPGWAVVRWDRAEAGDFAARWHVDGVEAARALLRRSDSADHWRVYVVKTSSRLLQWTITLAFVAADLGVAALVADDADAARAFRTLQLS
jgi:hypothetical protein